MKKNICIFAGSSSGIDKANKELAKLVGKTIAENNFDIVFGGGENGMMGSVASSSIAFGANTTGIIPDFFIKEDNINTIFPNKFNTKLIITKTMHERKQLMYNKSDAFLILPGGIGTLDECFEVLTWCQLNLIKNKNIGILNFSGYWDPLIALINNVISEGFMSQKNLNYFEEIKDIKLLKKFLNNI